MRIDRLLAITIYLLNRDTVTGKELAERFEVSERTIQRDIESINMAGIPIHSIRGASGGYSILDNFRLSKSPMSGEDIGNIIMALNGLKSAYADKQIDLTIDKLKSYNKSENDYISLDLSIIHENKNINLLLSQISKAINNKKTVSVEYTGYDGRVSLREVEPIFLKYKWYSWYLGGFCLEKQDYRIFKLSRIKKLSLLEKGFKNNHRSDDEFYETLINNDSREYVHIKLLCRRETEHTIKEYFPKSNLTDIDDESFFCEMSVPKNERIWYAILLSLGDNVKIMEPQNLKEKVYKNAKKIINQYKDDI